MLNKKLNILVCEDERIPRFFIANFLKRIQKEHKEIVFSVKYATNPKEAEAISEVKNGLILMDNYLGEGLTGTDILRKNQEKLKKMHENRKELTSALDSKIVRNKNQVRQARQTTPVNRRNKAGGINAQDPSTWGRVGRNESCPCGSGRKYKQCHGKMV